MNIDIHAHFAPQQMFDAPVKELGKFEVQVKVGAGVEATLKFWVVAATEE